MTEKNYVVNVKNKAGTIFTVRADTAVELASNIMDVINNSINDSVAALEELILGQATSPTVTPVTTYNPVEAVVNSLGGTVLTQEPAGFAPVPPPVQAAPAGVETIEDRWGNKWTYGRADAPISANGPMVLKQGTNQAGKAYVGFFDPAGGPRWQGAKIPSDQQTAPKFGVKL